MDQVDCNLKSHFQCQAFSIDHAVVHCLWCIEQGFHHDKMFLHRWKGRELVQLKIYKVHNFASAIKLSWISKSWTFFLWNYKEWIYIWTLYFWKFTNILESFGLTRTWAVRILKNPFFWNPLESNLESSGILLSA